MVQGISRTAGSRGLSALASVLLALAPVLASGFTSLFPVATAGAQTVPDDQVIAEIDRLIAEMWTANDVKESAAATDAEWCRRIFLDVLGRIPSVDELLEFTTSKSKTKRKDLVDRLLASDRYTEEYARNWTTLWSNLLIGRTGGNANGSRISRAGMQKYLRDSFARNKAYDRMVRELVTATGHPDPDDEKFNGAVNFLIDKVNDENAAQATAATTRIFLGLQVQCTQCHNHPFNDWKQQTYWEMNAFFRQVRATGNPGSVMMGQTSELVDVDFNGESNNIEEADLYYELRNGLIKVAYPVFVDGTSIDPNGSVERVNRRGKLAEMMFSSGYVEKAMVNRTWAHFLGYGMTRPIDDLGPHNPPSHPELLDYLSAKFRESGYDVRKLIRWVALSRPYSLSSRQPKNGETADNPDGGKPPLFSRYYLSPMSAEELYESLLVATRAGESAGDFETLEQRKNQWLQQFAQAFGTDEGDEVTSFAGTIPQVLMMFNGELIREATSFSEGNLINLISGDSSQDFKEKVDYLFLAGLARRSSSDESGLARQLYQARGNEAEALQDLWWVILNSNEFIFNH
jgi:Protein of unknown function (DUF1549)/Protein of unknown function (DUF1553)